MVPRKPVVQSFQISRMKQKFRCACNSIFGFSIQSHLVGHMPHPPRGLLEPLVKNIYPVIRICQPQCGQGTAGRICSIFWRFWGPDSNSTPAVRMCAWPFCDIERYSNNPTYQQNHTKPTTPKSIDDSSLPWHAMAMARVKYGMVMPTLLASFLGEDRGSVISTWSRLLGFPNRNGPTALTDIKSIQSILGVHCTRWLNLGRLFFIVNSLEKKNFTKRGLRKGAHFQTFRHVGIINNHQQQHALGAKALLSNVGKGTGLTTDWRPWCIFYTCVDLKTHTCAYVYLCNLKLCVQIYVYECEYFFGYFKCIYYFMYLHISLIVTSKRIVHLQISLLEICNMTSEIIIIN